MAGKNTDLLNKLSSPNTGAWEQKARWRQENSDWLADSRKVALLVIRTLRAKKMSKTELALSMGVTDQYVGKICKGEENFSFQTIKKLERALEIPILNIDAADSIYTMNVSAGSKEFRFAISGKRTEDSYAHSLTGSKADPGLTVFVKAGEAFTTRVEETCPQVN